MVDAKHCFQANKDGEIGILKALNAVMKALKPIQKDSKNQFQGYQYRSADAVIAELHTLFAENGIITPFSNIQTGETRQIQTKKGPSWLTRVHFEIDFIALDGSYLRIPGIADGLDNSDKAMGKAMTYAYKYVMNYIFCIPTEERKEDPDGYGEQIEKQMPAYRPEEMEMIKHAQAELARARAEGCKINGVIDSPQRAQAALEAISGWREQIYMQETMGSVHG